MGFLSKMLKLQSTLEESVDSIQRKIDSKIENMQSALDDKISSIQSSIEKITDSGVSSTHESQSMDNDEIDWAAISRSHRALLNSDDDESYGDFNQFDDEDEEDDESPLERNARLTSAFLQNSGIELVDLNTETASSEADTSETNENDSYSMFTDYDKDNCNVCLIKVGPNEAMIKGLLLTIGGLDADVAQHRLNLCHQGHNAVIARHLTESTAKVLIDGVRAMGGDALIV